MLFLLNHSAWISSWFYSLCLAFFSRFCFVYLISVWIPFLVSTLMVGSVLYFFSFGYCRLLLVTHCSFSTKLHCMHIFKLRLLMNSISLNSYDISNCKLDLRCWNLNHKAQCALFLTRENEGGEKKANQSVQVQLIVLPNGFMDRKSDCTHKSLFLSCNIFHLPTIITHFNRGVNFFYIGLSLYITILK